MLGSRRCDLSAWMWDFRSSSHLIPRFGDRPDRSPTRSPRHRITRLPIGASATDAVHQDDVDGQYPQSLMTSRWCPASNMSHWPRLGRGQPPCSCSAHSSTVKCCDTRRDTRLFGYRDTGTCGAGQEGVPSATGGCAERPVTSKNIVAARRGREGYCLHHSG